MAAGFSVCDNCCRTAIRAQLALGPRGGRAAKRSDLYRELLASVGGLASDPTVADSEVRRRLRSLVAEHQQRKPPTRARLVRDHMTLEIRPVRSLLSALMILPWEATPWHPVLAAIQLLRALYEHAARKLPTTTEVDLGRGLAGSVIGADREQAFRAFEVATLLALRPALRNGSVWIDHGLAFRSRERLFIPPDRWAIERDCYYQRMSLPKRAEVYLEPLIERAIEVVEQESWQFGSRRFCVVGAG